jgi:hypothetical protein
MKQDLKVLELAKRYGGNQTVKRQSFRMRQVLNTNKTLSKTKTL